MAGEKDAAQFSQKGDLSLNPMQRYIMQRVSKLVGKALTIAEGAIPEGQQCNAVKKSLENSLYEFRDELVEKLK